MTKRNSKSRNPKVVVNVNPVVETETETPVAIVEVDATETPVAIVEVDATEPVEVEHLTSIVARVVKGATDANHWLNNRDVRVNGVGTPRGWGVGVATWCFFDDCFAKGLRDRATIFEMGATLHGLSRGNMSTELSNYRTRHGYARESRKRVTVAPVSIQSTVAPDATLIAGETTLIKKVV
jgi:hypothetical protein